MKVQCIFLLAWLSCSTFANDSYSIYLVRHAEKQSEQENPNLTSCGQMRAKQLAVILENVDIKAIYSTSYQRTLATATPTSQQKKLPIKHYSPRDLEQFALSLKQLKMNALVVGHSNTTPQLTSLLSGEEVDDIDEKQYQMLYQVQFSAGDSTLTVLKQPLVCESS